MMQNVCNIYRFQNTLNYEFQWWNKENVEVQKNLLNRGERAVFKIYPQIGIFQYG